MKKMVLFLLCAVVAVSCIALTACGGNKDVAGSKYVGTWKIATVSLGDVSEGIDTDWTIVLNDDGTGQSISSEETNDFKWELTNNGFKTTGGLKLTFTDEGDNIKTKVIGVNLLFEKQ